MDVDMLIVLGVGLVTGAVAGGALTKSRLELTPAGVGVIVVVGGIAFGNAPAADAMRFGCASCRYLDASKRCMIYPVRPTICRLWSVTEDMPCQWGCRKTGTLSGQRGLKILRGIRAVTVRVRC